MKLYFEAHFKTDDDFGFDTDVIEDKFNANKSLYKEADITFDYHSDAFNIDIVLIANGDANACRWSFRDLIEGLICSIRTFKHYLVKDLYELLIYFHKDLWTTTNQVKSKDLTGNYSGTLLILKIEE